MHFVGKPPIGVDLAPVEASLRHRPPTIWGDKVKWLVETPPELVYIAEFRRSVKGPDKRVFLIAARYELTAALVAGKAAGDGYIIEYTIATLADSGTWATHRLQQFKTAVYAEWPESADSVDAGKVRNQSSLCAAAPPKWKDRDALWPIASGQPMSFLGQVAIPETPLTRKHLTHSEINYLFWRNNAGRDCFKLLTQRTDVQTAEDHYREEEERWAREAE